MGARDLHEPDQSPRRVGALSAAKNGLSLHHAPLNPHQPPTLTLQALTHHSWGSPPLPNTSPNILYIKNIKQQLEASQILSVGPDRRTNDRENKCCCSVMATAHAISTAGTPASSITWVWYPSLSAFYQAPKSCEISLMGTLMTPFSYLAWYLVTVNPVIWNNSPILIAVPVGLLWTKVFFFS